jgi:hypothetical protein
VSATKPPFVTETGCVEATSSEAAAGNSKAEWFKALSSYLPTLPRFSGLFYFNQHAQETACGCEADYTVESSSAAAAAWKQYFVENPIWQ